MTKRPSLTGEQVLSALQVAGYHVIRIKGSQNAITAPATHPEMTLTMEVDD